ncbi:carboxymuconolactone decarboxylase [Streptomyces cavourensis]|nr:carboxymuconolactone decarboxylase [Streptomyces cavourensis]
MSRIPLVDATSAPAASRDILRQIHGAFGATPNMFRAVANSPAALQSLWAAFGALGGGVLPAHTALGRKAGASAEQMAAAQAGRADDPQTAAALDFALKLVRDRGQLRDADVAALRQAGFDDGQIVELLAHVALNLFTNYVNVAFDVPVDFPKVALRAA